MIFQIGGGGILCLNLNAVELNCTNRQDCEISTPQSEITNHSNLITGGQGEGIYINAYVGTFINYGDISVGSGNQAFSFKANGYIRHFINHGNIATDGSKMSLWITIGGGISKLTNYGVMGGIEYKNNLPMTINNFGVIKRFNNSNLYNSNVIIQNYMLMVDEGATAFNNYNNTNSLSHLVISGNGVNFKDGHSKIILDFGSGFEFGAEYKISKIATDTSGNPYNDLNVNFDRLTTRTSLYKLTQSGEYFIANIDAPNSEIGILHKSNIHTMNNFYVISNSMIYPRKLQNLGSSSLRDSALDSANILKSYESFAYRNESQNRRIQRQNKRNYSRESLKTQNLKQPQNLTTDSANQNNSSLRADSQNLRGNPQINKEQDYYFILTPFINHNLFFESGRYNLSGFDYGFLTAFSARVAESNSLGAHFMMSYGSLGDSKDKDFMIKSLNLNVGVNYKLDLILDMFIKARGDFYYFSNALDSLTIKNIKPNNLGFGASVSYGKEWDFKSGGMLGIEAGLDYKALQSSTISLHDNIYQKALYNLIYADLGLNYQKYFGGFGINLGGGFRANLAPKLAESALLINSQTLKFTLDNDKYLGYANAGISYVLNAKSFDMEFSLAYYGNYGDRIISNAGGFEWRVVW